MSQNMSQTATIIQISDPHLFATREQTLAEVPTWETLRDVTDLIRARTPDFDRLVVTGDIAHDEIEPTYAALASELGDWLPRSRFVPGNHDAPGAMARVFGTPGWPLDGCTGFVDELGDWRVVGLDSHVPGEVSGSLGARQIDWLETTLAEEPGRPTAVFVHHPPVPVGPAWLRDLGLQDGDALTALAERHTNLRFVGCGHVHQVSEARVGEALICSAPSTAMQFTASGQPKRSPTEAPGYRWVELGPDSVRTGVTRAEPIRYPPKSSSGSEPG